MVLPDIDEELEDDGVRLSLTSLLLESSNIVAHIGLGDLPAVKGQTGGDCRTLQDQTEGDYRTLQAQTAAVDCRPLQGTPR